MQKTVLKDMKGLMGELPPLFRALALTLDNKCECKVCAMVRKELVKMAKQHEVTQVLNKVT